MTAVPQRTFSGCGFGLFVALLAITTALSGLYAFGSFVESIFENGKAEALLLKNAEIALAIFVVAAIFLVASIVLANRHAAYRTQVAVAQEAERRAELERWITETIPPIVLPGFVCDEGEAAYYEAPAKLLGVHSQVQRKGHSQGVSVRVVRGVYLRSGTFQSNPETTQYTTVDDTGSLIVTNQRVIFLGNAHTLAMPLRKILQTVFYTDGVRLDVENARPLTFVTDDARTAVVVERARLGKLRAADV